MRKNYTDIAVVLDRLGSMEMVKSDTIGGFNQFLKAQKALPGEATMTLVKFDDRYDVEYEGRAIKESPELNDKTFEPRGSTALRDAIGRTIVRVGQRLKAIDESNRPEKVIFVIITDGYENASREFTMEKISEMIAHQRDVYKWEFVFLGANQDAIATAGGMSISASNAMTYAANAVGTAAAFGSLTRGVSAYRSGVSMNASFTSEDRDEQTKAGA
jgi:hypothetical protein